LQPIKLNQSNFRTVTELSQEVSDTMEERVVLEYQLEQLKSFGNQD
jgi:hypothetical protein